MVLDEGNQILVFVADESFLLGTCSFLKTPSWAAADDSFSPSPFSLDDVGSSFVVAYRNTLDC